MPNTALTHDDIGRLVVPTGRGEWDGWVSATRTRNCVLGDPLVDWLNRYGEMKGYERDRPDPRTDFLGFVFRKAREFETRVVTHLIRLLPGGVRTILSADASPSQVVSLAAAEATWEAMAGGTPIIYQGVLWDTATGCTALLISWSEATLCYPCSTSPYTLRRSPSQRRIWISVTATM